MKRQSHSSRGAALLAAMLTVSLVAMLAAGAAWQQWRTVEVESTERQHAQAQWLLLGALDWARIILREDARSGNADAPTDHLAEPWAIPLQEARLSTFLEANSNSSAVNKSVTKGNSTISNTFSEDALTQEAYLSGQIIDLQARMNVSNLLQGSQIDLKSLQAFERLFEALSLPTAQVNSLAQGLVAAQQQKDGAPLMPQRISQLTWLGLTPQTLNSLASYITVLPTRTPVNLNTAPPVVMYASVAGLSLADAKRLSDQRAQNPWSGLDAFQKAAGKPVSVDGTHSVNSRFFEVVGRLRMPATSLVERSVVQRDQVDVKVLWRESGSLQ
ncbi:MAG: general secretion pathway protein GspK [Betaproteobacteria bacterium]|nr:general secretion pathway protein GspK [Betaproteobacteria bacterium]